MAEIQWCTLILLGLDIFLKNIKENQRKVYHTAYLEYNLMKAYEAYAIVWSYVWILLYRFHKIYDWRKNFVRLY